MKRLSCFAPLQFGDPCVEVEPLLNGETLALLFFRVESIIIDVIKDQKREIQFQFFLLHYYLISYFTLTAVGKTVLGFFFDSILKL